tara:strand:+ start:73 stop:1074 length:1002 start_codon:yes stop_codon:yes gene_type:complete
MKLFGKNLEKNILYVAEIGVNHEGNFNKLKKLVREAKTAGADVVKFQCYTPDKYVTKENEKFSRISKFFISEDEFKKIIKFCKKIKIHYLFTPLSHDWLKFIKNYSKTVKVASGDLNFNHFIKKITDLNLNIILSTGASDFSEIKTAIKIIKKKYKNKTKKKLILMHCVSSYPVPDKFANMLSVKYLKDRFNLITGYSNHVIGINACLASICLGAKIIEFHFTDNKKRKFRDHQLSLNKSDAKKLIQTGNNLNTLLGDYKKELSKIVKKDKKYLNKGIVANKNLFKNKKLKLDDLTYARPAKYFHANQINKILNKKLKKDIKSGMLISKKIIF